MRIKYFLFTTLLVLLVAGAALPQVGLAQFGFNITSSNISNALNLNTVLNNVTNIVLGVLVAVAVIFAIVSGYTYLTAAGDTAKVRKASEMLIYAGVAVGVGLLAKGVINLVLAILGATTDV